MKQMLMEKFIYWAEIGCDLVLLNLLWLFCCLPIVTIGASTTAMHYVVRKMAMGEPYKVWSGFWGSFKGNWKQSSIMFLILVILAAICGADFYIGSQVVGGLGLACQVIGILGLILTVCVLTLVFPLLARYTQSIPALLKSALLLSMTNPHVVIAGCAATLLFPVLVLLNESFLVIAIPAWLLVGGALAALTVQLMLKPVYARLEKSIPMEEMNHGDSETETHL